MKRILRSIGRGALAAAASMVVLGTVAACAAGGSLRPVSEVTPAATPAGSAAAPAPGIAPARGPAGPAVAGSAPAVAPGAPSGPGLAAQPSSAVVSQVVPVPTPAAGFVRGIVVSGTGRVAVRPDQAVVTAGVQTRAATAQQAQDQNNRLMQAVIDAIKALKIPDRDVQTSGISLYPIMEQGQTVTGYSASNNVTVTVENVDQVGAVLDAAVRAGANQATGIRFGLKDATAARNKALAAAAADARSKADALATALGLQISGILSVSEQSTGGPIVVGPRPAAAAAAESVPVEPGELDVTAEVTIVFGY